MEFYLHWNSHSDASETLYICNCLSINMAATPVKTITRLQLTPTTKQHICIICGQNIINKNYRLKLFHKNEKTSHCHLLEKHSNVLVSQSGSTDHAGFAIPIAIVAICAEK